jgi:hypothetical protein
MGLSPVIRGSAFLVSAWCDRDCRLNHGGQGVACKLLCAKSRLEEVVSKLNGEVSHHEAEIAELPADRELAVEVIS